jgi:hypothetical protein
MTFEDVLRQVRAATRRRVIVPAGRPWQVVDQGSDGIVLDVELPTATFGANLQNDLPATPFFALCIAWWFERATGQRADVRIRLIGGAPTNLGAQLHVRRAQFLLDETARLLGSRFTVSPAPGWRWPARPILNAPRVGRSDRHNRDPLSEHALAVHISSTQPLIRAFPAPVAFLHRQFPVGLFDGVVSKATAWTPGGASQLDLWGPSPDGRVLHPIELKTVRNSKVGILPEALYYLRLLQYVRRGQVGGGHPDLDYIRRADRIVMWLVAPEWHPLVYLRGQSPIAWLNEAMVGDGVEMRVLPIDVDTGGRVTWRLTDAWPRPA